MKTFVSLERQERRKYSAVLYLCPLLPENIGPPSSPSQKDEDPPEHTSRHRESYTHTHTRPWLCEWGERTACNLIPRTQRVRWLFYSAQPERTHRPWPRLAAPPPFSSAAPPARDPHRYVHQSWPSRRGTWWASSGPGSYLFLGNGWSLMRV